MNKYLDLEHDLVKTGDGIDWVKLENEFKSYYSDRGRPSVPIRKIIGLCLLKTRFKTSDEKTLNIWLENPYWQHFCGEVHFQVDKPFSPGEFSRFRKRVGATGISRIQSLASEHFGITVDGTYSSFEDQVKVPLTRRIKTWFRR